MSMGSEWDERLRDALLEAARLDGEAALAALPGEPDFSWEYLRARKRLLHNPFRYARRRSRSRRKAVLWYAACALVTLCLSAALVHESGGPGLGGADVEHLAPGIYGVSISGGRNRTCPAGRLAAYLCAGGV